MHAEYTLLFFVCLKSLKLQPGTNLLGLNSLFFGMFETLKSLTNSSRSVISNKNLLPWFVSCCHFQHLHSVLKYFSLKTQFHRCPLTVLKWVGRAMRNETFYWDGRMLMSLLSYYVVMLGFLHWRHKRRTRTSGQFCICVTLRLCRYVWAAWDC